MVSPKVWADVCFSIHFFFFFFLLFLLFPASMGFRVGGRRYLGWDGGGAGGGGGAVHFFFSFFFCQLTYVRKGGAWV